MKMVKNGRRMDNKRGLKVIGWVGSEDLNDPDTIPTRSWSGDESLPCYYIGAWKDGLDFLGKDNEFASEQRSQPQRHFFVFNQIPLTLAGIEEAIKEWANGNS